MIKIEGLKELTKGMEQLSSGINKLSKLENEKIVENSKKLKGNPKVSNRTEVADTPENARRTARLNNSQLQKPTNESQTPPDELNRATDMLAQDFVRSIVTDLLKGA